MMIIIAICDLHLHLEVTPQMTPLSYHVSLLESCPALHCTEEAGARLPPTLATAAVQRLQSVQRIRTGIYINGFHCTAVEPLYSTRAGHGDSTREAGPGRCSVVGRAGKGRKGKGRAGQGRAVRISIALHCTATAGCGLAPS